MNEHDPIGECYAAYERFHRILATYPLRDGEIVMFSLPDEPPPAFTLNLVKWIETALYERHPVYWKRGPIKFNRALQTDAVDRGMRVIDSLPEFKTEVLPPDLIDTAPGATAGAQTSSVSDQTSAPPIGGPPTVLFGIPRGYEDAAKKLVASGSMKADGRFDASGMLQSVGLVSDVSDCVGATVRSFREQTSLDNDDADLGLQPRRHGERRVMKPDVLKSIRRIAANDVYVANKMTQYDRGEIDFGDLVLKVVDYQDGTIRAIQQFQRQRPGRSTI